MTQADGETRIHETVYENRFGFVSELKKMGAKIEIYKPDVENPEELYNFNFNPKQEYRQGVKIIGKTPLHNGVLYISDLRAGATLVIAALIAKGESVIYGVEQIERGYEDFDTRLRQLGADIRVEEEI
jgi:UDP-N-acetylglucosamine 1-carboxyvinyltransferase